MTIGPGLTIERRTITVLIVTVALLALGLILRSTVVGGDGDFWINVVSIGVLALLSRTAAMSAEELGTGPRYLGSGLRWGGAAFAIISALLVLAALVPESSGFFDDDRADISAGQLWLKTLVVIPIGTVVLEELAFRGVLLGLLHRLTSTAKAVAFAAVLFGLWHVPTAWNTASGQSHPARIAAVAGTVVATTVAGLVFCFLRIRSRSLLAPMLAHIATNSVTFALAWSLSRP
jgi:membrane protease YdiL (CAAX protease family)